MNSTTRSKSINYLVKVAVLGALSGLVMLLQFPILPAAPFLKFDFSNVITLIGGFALGPSAAFFIDSIRLMIDCLEGSSTGYVGELSAWILGITYSVPASILYKYKKGFKWAFIAVVISFILSNLVGIISNWFVMFPLFGIPQEAIPNMVLTTVIPFNVIKYFIVSTIVLLLYKPLSPLLKKTYTISKKEKIENSSTDTHIDTQIKSEENN